MASDRTIFQLQAELDRVKDKLDKEKSKRAIIMVIFYSIVCAFLLYNRLDFSNLLSIVAFIAICLFLGGCLFYASSLVFVMVSSIFTNINSFEEQVRLLEELIKKAKIENGTYNDDEW